MASVKGRFVQTDPRGTTSSGDLYIRRPGKARFTYDAPRQLLIVSDGSRVSVYDARLKTSIPIPLDRHRCRCSWTRTSSCRTGWRSPR